MESTEVFFTIIEQLIESCSKYGTWTPNGLAWLHGTHGTMGPKGPMGTTWTMGPMVPRANEPKRPRAHGPTEHDGRGGWGGRDGRNKTYFNQGGLITTRKDILQLSQGRCAHYDQGGHTAL